MSASLLGDLDTWDLCVDANGDIAVATPPYSQVQDAASAILVFQGECYYDTTQGVPYLTPPASGQNILGKSPPMAFVKAKAIAAAKTVPGVTGATLTLASIKDRTLTGQLQITTETSAATINF